MGGFQITSLSSPVSPTMLPQSGALPHWLPDSLKPHLSQPPAATTTNLLLDPHTKIDAPTPWLGTKAATIHHQPYYLQEPRLLTDLIIAPGDDTPEQSLEHELSLVMKKILQGDAGAQTFATLDVLQNKLADAARPDLKNQLSLLHALASFKKGSHETAIKELDTLIQSQADNTLLLNALIIKAEIFLSMGTRVTGKQRELSFKKAFELLTKDTPKVVTHLHLADQERMRQLLAGIYFNHVHFFIQHDFPRYALETAQFIVAHFRNSEAVNIILSHGPQNPVRAFVKEENHSLQDLADPSPLCRLVSGARELVHHGAFRRNQDFWKILSAGACLSMGITAILTGETDFSSMIQAIAWGGTASVGTARLYLGATSAETRQSLQTGYSRHTAKDTLKTGLWETTKMFLTYALSGGALPGLGELPTLVTLPAILDIPNCLVAEALGNGWGRLHGAGSLFAGAFATVADRGQEIITLLHAFGLKEGLEIFCRNFRETSSLGSSLGNGLDYFSNAIHYARAAMLSDAYTLLKSVIFPGPDSSLLETILKPYALISGLYGTVMMLRPQLREGLQRVFQDNLAKIELALLPGAHIFFANVGIATGVDPLQAYLIPFPCYLPQIRQFVQSGGRLLQKNVVYEYNWAAMMTVAGVQFLYAGPGQAIRANLSPFTLGHYYWESLGIQAWLIYTIAMLHAPMMGLSVVQTLKAKTAKGPTYEQIGNLFKMMLGWASANGNAISIFIKELFLGSAVTNSYRESSGAPTQFNVFQGQLLKLHKLLQNPNSGERVFVTQRTPNERSAIEDLTQEFKAAAAILQDMARESVTVREFYADRSPEEKLQLIPTLYFSPENTSNLLAAKPSKDAYRTVVYRALMDPQTQPTTVRNFLHQLEAVLADQRPGFSDMRDNLLIATWATRHGPHAALVSSFLAARAQLHQVPTVTPTDISFLISGESQDEFVRTHHEAWMDELRKINKSKHPKDTIEKIEQRAQKKFGKFAALKKTKYAQEILSRTAQMARDPYPDFTGDKGAMLGQVIQIKTGPFKGLIRSFLNRNPDISARNIASSPQGDFNSKKTRLWFNQHHSGGTDKVGATMDRLEKSFAVSARRWPFSNPITGRNVMQIATPFTAFLSLFSSATNDPTFQTTPDVRFYTHTIFRSLMSVQTTTREIEALLAFAKYFLAKTDSGRRDVQHNLLLTIWAAAKGSPHEKLIQEFLQSNRWMLGFYNIPVDDAEMRPRSFRPLHVVETWRTTRWFARRLINSDVSADGILEVPVMQKGRG